MQHEIRRFRVQHPLLKNYIKFFWEFRAAHLQVNHKLIPQRNINMRVNLSDASHHLYVGGEEHKLENVHIQGMQDHFRNAHLKSDGKVHILGVCFYPDGFYPFFKIPVFEFNNQLPGASDVGLVRAEAIIGKLRDTPDIHAQLILLENELLSLLIKNNCDNDHFHRIFNALNHINRPIQLSEFCAMNNIGARNLERMFRKFVGLSASAYYSLNRFQNSLNQLLRGDYGLLSDVAYNNGYFDQMHFIREFKKFAGCTPRKFAIQQNSILQIGKLK